MSILWYPTPKQSPILGSLGLGGGIGSNLITSSGPVDQVDSSAAHFYDFSTSYEDQRGSIDFNTNTSEMALGSSGGSYGNPPGWSG